jgi:predicted Zn-dependent peptidase
MPNRLRQSALVCAAVTLLSAPIGSAAQKATAHITPPPPQPFVLPTYSRQVLPNGLTLLMLEKHEVPLVSATLLLRSGTVADPKGKEGLATLTSELLRRGTPSRSAEAFSNDLDFIGMQFNTSAGLDSTTISANFLKKDQAAALSLLTDAVLHPAFTPAEFAKTLGQLQDQVRATKDEPQQVLGLYFRAFLYGPDNPYGRPPAGDELSLRGLTRDDVTGFYTANYTPSNAILAISGDFDSAAMNSAIQQAFGNWEGKAPPMVPLPAAKPQAGRRLLLVDKPDATQTYFAMGNIGIDATDPRRGPIQVVNTLFGGRFTSLFNTELRIKSGYSYGASSSFSQLRAPGPFTMATFTKNATTGPAMDKTIEVVNTAHTAGFTEAQLTSAKNSIAGELPPSLETSQQLANTLARNELYGITRDQFNANLIALQETSVAQEKHLLAESFPSADNLVIVVVGKASEIQPLMSKYTTNITVRKIGDSGY